MEGLIADGALADFAAVPRVLETGLAEIVSARSGHRVSEHLLTDGALELLIW